MKEEMGMFAMIRESVRVITTQPKLFLGFTSMYILPICIVNILLTEPILKEFWWDMLAASQTSLMSPSQDQISANIRKELTKLGPKFVLYAFFLLAFSFFTTSAIVYSTVGCIYSTENRKSCKEMLKAVPRLAVTFSWALIVISCCHILNFLMGGTKMLAWSVGGIGGAMTTVYVVGGKVYAECVWHLAVVSTVLGEDICGLEAIMKGLTLIQGRLPTSLLLFLARLAFTLPIRWAFFRLASSSITIIVIFFDFFLVVAMAFFHLISLITQTFFYFSCVAYHHENNKLQWPKEHLHGSSRKLVLLLNCDELDSLEP